MSQGEGQALVYTKRETDFGTDVLSSLKDREG